MVPKPDIANVAGSELPVHSFNTVIIGSGAAGLNAALQLAARGQRDIALVTDCWSAGTSRNAGSDKQTYYKLSLAGSGPDSPRQLAEDLFAGGCTHGDHALCEANLSAQAFYLLVERGVPFPSDRCGGYVGYRTDHDPVGRGTSAGPLTSRFMCDCLGRAVREAGIPVFDRHTIVSLLTRESGCGRCVCGAVALDGTRTSDDSRGFVLFNALNIVLATGGPGGMYKASVYPGSQVGSIGLALAIGARANNLTESQFGIASIGFRWNLSGSYQQVIPRYVSTDESGGDEREFLGDYFPDVPTLSSAIFRKGYEWPFDCDLVAGQGSSLIDLAVYEETQHRGRRAYLDFARNPTDVRGCAYSVPDDLDEEAAAYLRSAGVSGATPIERLLSINPDAAEVFRDNGIDLGCERVEISVCAQHNNGGLAVNAWWESNIRHLFPVGEVAGTHGVRRPGGAALNAGQVGGIRAAAYIAERHGEPPPTLDNFVRSVGGQVEEVLRWAALSAGQRGGRALRPSQVLAEIQERMSRYGGMVRSPAELAEAYTGARSLHERVIAEMHIESPAELASSFRSADLCLAHMVYLGALVEYLDAGGGSRGSALVLDPAGVQLLDGLSDTWRVRPTDADSIAAAKILEVSLDESRNLRAEWVDVRPIPDEDTSFERVWAESRMRSHENRE